MVGAAPALGAGAIGVTITGQAFVFKPGVTQPRFSTKAGMVVNS